MLVAMAACVLALASCGAERGRGAGAGAGTGTDVEGTRAGQAPLRTTPTAPAAASGAPPAVAFVPPTPWQSTRKGSAPLPPPDPALETWRALASQTTPLQIKTPHWQPLPADRTVELAMPEGSTHRCVVAPLQVTAEADDFGRVLHAWVLSRTLTCSSDGFSHWTEHHHVVHVRPDGTREVSSEGGALLRERDAAGVVRQSFVMLRADEERKVATTGPPRIVPGVEVD